MSEKVKLRLIVDVEYEPQEFPLECFATCSSTSHRWLRRTG